MGVGSAHLEDTVDLHARRKRGRVLLPGRKIAVFVDGPEEEESPFHAARRRDATYRRLLACADLLACAVALAVTLAWLGEDQLTPAMIVLAPGIVLVAKLMGLYDRDEVLLRKSTLDEAPALLQGATLFAFALAVLDDRLFAVHVGDGQLALLWIVLLLVGLGCRLFARRIARALTTPDRCLVLGSREQMKHFQEKVSCSPGVKAEIVGRVALDDESHDNEPPDDPLGTLRDVEQVVAQHAVHRVLVAPQTTGGDALVDVIQRLKGCGVKVSILPRIFEVVGSSVQFDDVDGMTMLGVKRFGLTQSSSIVKRGFDLCGAGLLLVLAAPLLALIAGLVKLSSPGPVFFRQSRVGRDGKTFAMFKFRTMYSGADEHKADLLALNEASEGFFKMKNDPRVTPLGRILRKSSLDELPQLLNVLRGEMSLVGPRPLVAEEDRRVVGWHRRRLHLKPGMTGHWQILGSSRIPMREMVTIDYLYVANWSLWTDVKILLRTVPHVCFQRSL